MKPASRAGLAADDVRYLVFEGGGGKGAAYEGVFDALTAHNLLPRRRGSTNIVGVAGASAGALTALYVALGLRLEDLREELKHDFNTFLDGSDPGSLRGLKLRAPLRSEKKGVGPVQSYVAKWGPAPPGGQRWDAAFDKVDAAGFKQRALRSAALAEGWKVKAAETAAALVVAISNSIGVQVLQQRDKLALQFLVTILRQFSFATELKSIPRATADDPVALLEKQMHSDMPALSEAILGFVGADTAKVLKPYLDKILGAGTAGFGRSIHALAYDRGLFVGAEMREYCARTLRKWLRLQSMEEARDLSFKRFEELTGCQFCVSGTNITQRKSGYFSAMHTPDFPVADAVALSMSLPFIFKPVLINYAGAANVDDEAGYAGLWVDGGLLNNLPIHAFDGRPAAGQEPYAMPLNPAVLAFRLFDGDKPDFGKEIRHPAKGDENDPLFCEFNAHFGDVMETILSPSEDGQLRTKQEVAQTVEIYCGSLSTYNFAGGDSGPANKNARDAIAAYFMKASGQRPKR